MRKPLRSWGVQLTPAMAGVPNEPNLRAGFLFASSNQKSGRGAEQKGSYTPNFRAPGRRSIVKLPRRTLIQILLILFLPPVGLAVLWRNSRYPLRGRMLLSVLAMASMTLIFSLFLSSGGPDPVSNSPVVPVAASAATPEPTPSPTPEATMEPTPSPSPEPTPTVYVYVSQQDASVYHASAGNNRRQLTLDEAVAEGLEPCPDCYPSTEEEE